MATGSEHRFGHRFERRLFQRRSATEINREVRWLSDRKVAAEVDTRGGAARREECAGRSARALGCGVRALQRSASAGPGIV
jgi:hypothetical protein